MSARDAERPDVTVIMPAYDAASTLRAAAEAALAQEGVSVELLIVDDGSADATAALAGALAAEDPRVRALATPGQSGPAAARNRALAEARGVWVAMLDADDGMAPRRLARMIALARAQAADVVLGNLAEAGPDGIVREEGRFLQAPDRPVRWNLEEFVAGNVGMSGGRTLGYLKPLVRNEVLQRHGIRYDESLRNGEDFHFILALYAAGASVWFSPEPDYVYTRRAGSLSHRADPGHLAALLAADAAFMSGRDGRRLTRLFRRRRRAIGRLLTTETALAALRARRPAGALRRLAADPAALPTLMRHLGQAAWKRRPGAAGPARAGRVPEEGVPEDGR